MSPLSDADRAAIGRCAELRRGIDQRVEHRLQIERRAADDLQHVGGRGLLLQRLGQIARARLHLVEQPRVLDRDHRLVGEGLHELDLAIGKKLSTRGARAMNMPIGSPSRISGTSDAASPSACAAMSRVCE